MKAAKKVVVVVVDPWWQRSRQDPGYQRNKSKERGEVKRRKQRACSTSGEESRRAGLDHAELVEVDCAKTGDVNSESSARGGEEASWSVCAVMHVRNKEKKKKFSKQQHNIPLLSVAGFVDCKRLDEV